MYKCFIIDDESHAIDTLKKYAIDSGLLEIVGSSQNPLEAIIYINENKDVDITFLDIDMPELSGLEVADLIYKNTAIIFTTGHAGYAVQGFEKNISDFLLKPISFERFLKSLHKVTERLKKSTVAVTNNENHFFVNPGIKGKLLKIHYDDITYIEGLNNYIQIHTLQNSQIVYLTLKEIELGLLPDMFMRIHKSFIININKITMMEGNKIILNQITLPIGSAYKKAVLDKITKTLIKTNRS